MASESARSWGEEDPVCYACVDDPVLREMIRDRGRRRTCANCGARRKAVTLAELAATVDPVYRRYHRPGDLWPAFDEDGEDDGYEQQGSYPEEIIHEMIGGEYRIAEAVLDILAGGEQWAVVHDGELEYYDPTSRYEFVPEALSPVEQHAVWRTFEERVKYVRRFYDDVGREFLAHLLDDVRDLRWEGRPGPVQVLAPGESLSTIYRARRAETEAAARRILRNPLVEMGPPPPRHRMPGRMNAPGIAVFYGAFSPDTCVAEIRPSVGGYVVLGKFEVIRPLTVLDLTIFQGAPPGGSMFREDYAESVARWLFLRDFHRLISRAVQPHEEFLEYVPTQVVADYLANVLGFDGVIYSSAQMGWNTDEEDDDPPEDHDMRNVALFNAQGLVEQLGDASAEPEIGNVEVWHVPAFLPERFEELAREKTASPALRLVPDGVSAYQIRSVRFGKALRRIDLDEERRAEPLSVEFDEDVDF
jgi:hypothetical protein